MPVLKYNIANPSFINLVDNRKIDLFTYKKACAVNCIGVKISHDNIIHPSAMKILQECEKIGLIVIGVMYGNPSLEIIQNVFPKKVGRIPCIANNSYPDKLEKTIEEIYKEWNKFPFLYTTFMHSLGNAKYCPHWFQWYGNFQYDDAVEVVAHEYTNGVFTSSSEAPKKFHGANNSCISQLLITGNDLARKAGYTVNSKLG